MISSAISLFARRTPPAIPPLPPPPDEPIAPRGEKRNAPSSPSISDATIPENELNIDSLFEKIEILEVRVGSLLDTVEHQHDRISALESTVEQQKILTKSSNIVIYGVPEQVMDTDVRKFFAGDVHLQSQVNNILQTFRLGPFRANAARPRPILVKFNSQNARNAAFQFSRRLRARSFSLLEDLTPGQQEARRRILPKFQSLKAQGYVVFWRGANIWFRLPDGKTKQWVPGAAPPGPPPARAYQESHTARTFQESHTAGARTFQESHTAGARTAQKQTTGRKEGRTERFTSRTSR